MRSKSRWGRGEPVAESTTLDDYDLINCLATGNSTQVWEVKQKSSGQQFAMKLLLPEAFKDPEQKASLKHEATVGKLFDHPNIIRIFDLVMSKKQGYFIMEFFRSVNLKQMLRGERPAVQARLKKILEGLTQALAHMHEKGWIHKDIKPDNILLTKGSEVKLIDFSLASKPSGGLTKLMGGSKSMVIQGTRTYIAPELIRRKPLTVSADVYSLGITFYEVVTGRPPFVHSNPNELLMAHVKDSPERPSGFNSNITPEADALIMRMLSKKPEGRPGSMQELFAEVRNLKIFKEDPEEHAKEQAKKAEDKFQDSMDSRLDSRSDAGRDRSAAPAPAKAKPKVLATSVGKPAALPPSKAQAPAAAPAAAAPQMPPGYPPPGYPQQFPPGYPPQMPPGYGYPPGYAPPPGAAVPPGAAPPGWPPGYPPQMPPGYGYPPGFVPPAAAPPVPAVTVPAAPQAPVAAQPPSAPAGLVPPKPSGAPLAAPPPPHAAALDEEDEENLPLMTELPEVM
jgi:serine/threonine protein kinase